MPRQRICKCLLHECHRAEKRLCIRELQTSPFRIQSLYMPCSKWLAHAERQAKVSYKIFSKQFWEPAEGLSVQVKRLLCSAKAVLRDIPKTHQEGAPVMRSGRASSAEHPAPSLSQAGSSQSPASSRPSSPHDSPGSCRASHAAPAAAHHACSSASAIPAQLESASKGPADHECCIVCMERAAVVMFKPCGHMLTCQACASACLQRRAECPMCRSKVLGQQLRSSEGSLPAP